LARSASSTAASTLRTFVSEDRHRDLLDGLVLAAHETLNKPKAMEAILRRELPTLLKLCGADAAQSNPKSITEKYAFTKRAGGESVSQSPLKDKAFSTSLDQNPPLELRPENGISPSTNARPAQWHVTDNSAIKRLAKGKLPSHQSASSVGL
jgi:hypothetical protein